jgi:hypothetical protein
MGSAKFKGAGLPGRCTGIAEYDSQDFEWWGRSGVLERIVVNAATTVGVIEVFDEIDGTTGTAKASLALGLVSGSVIELGFIMDTGLTVDLAGADDVTVVYNANRD